MKRAAMRKEMRKIENRYHISFGVRLIVSAFLTSVGRCVGSFVSWPMGVMLMSPDLTKRESLEALYHELGHAFVRKYKKTLMPEFKRRRDWTDDYHRRGRRLANTARLPGFVSGYARTNSEEDFCETFSCYLLNRRTTGVMKYEGERFEVWEGTRLHKKLLCVEKELKKGAGRSSSF